MTGERKKKFEFRFFTIAEYAEEQEYLRSRHKAGWKFVNVTFPGIYHFVKCDPEDVVYQLGYNKGREYEKEEYVQMFRDCGWEYLMDFVGYSYFCKPVAMMKEGEEEIFCDDSSRLDMVARIFKGRVIPLLIIFFCAIIPFLLRVIFSEGPVDLSCLIIFLVCFVIYLIIFIKFSITYRRLKKK